MKKNHIVSVIGGLVTALAVSPVGAATFTVASGPGGSGSSSFSGIPTDDLLAPGAAPGLVVPGAGFGFGAGAGFIDVDAFSFGKPAVHADRITSFQFSVTPGTAGFAGTALAAEAGFGEQPADVYSSVFGSGTNGILFDGNGAPPVLVAPPLGLSEFGAGGNDDVNGYDNGTVAQGGIVYFSVTTADAALIGGGIYAGASGADVFMSSAFPGYDVPPAVPYAPAGALGLDVGGVNTDEIDAMIVFEDGDGVWAGPTDMILFSLSATSASLAVGAPSPYAGLLPEDILFATPGGGAGLFLPGGALGIAGGDLNALDSVPEPGTAGVLVLGLGICLMARRRRS